MNGVALAGWCRTPIAPRHGALRHYGPHLLAAPLIAHLLQAAHLPAHSVDTLILGNALGGGGNPARLAALAAGLSQGCTTLTIDTQCCSGLDAINLAATQILSGQAEIALAGGAESWSRSPIRQHRPIRPGDPPVPYERPPFTPWPERDPDPLQAAFAYGLRHHWTRSQQDAYAHDSHRRAVQATPQIAASLVALGGLDRDSYPRLLTPGQQRRIPELITHPSCALSRFAVSPQADGAALVLMLSASACRRYGLAPSWRWLAGISLGTDPANPLTGALAATQTLLRRLDLGTAQLDAMELHDAFAVQGLAFRQALISQGGPVPPLNAWGGGLARGHPIGASGAVALVQLLSRLQATPTQPLTGLACIAAAGGLGTATLVGAAAPSPADPA